MQKELMDEFYYLSSQATQLREAREFLHHVFEIHSKIPKVLMNFYCDIDKRLNMLQNERRTIVNIIDKELM